MSLPPPSFCFPPAREGAETQLLLLHTPATLEEVLGKQGHASRTATALRQQPFHDITLPRSESVLGLLGNWMPRGLHPNKFPRC